MINDKGSNFIISTKNKILIFTLISIVIILSVQFAAAYANPATVNLGTAGNFVILAKSGISTTGITSIVGDIGVSPIDSTAITGFGLSAPPTTFTTSSLVTGKVYASNYALPTPTIMTTAISDMEAAYTDAAGRPSDETVSGSLGGLTLAPGVYTTASNLIIPTDVILSGGANDVWIFQIAGNLDISSGKKIILIGGAQAKNIFWQVAGTTTLETTSVFNGNILGGSGASTIALRNGAILNGRALAQKDVTLIANRITLYNDSSMPQEYCGDGIKNGNEICDEGNLNGQVRHCNAQCTGTTNANTTIVCGNHILELGEQCDDSNSNNNDACKNDCTLNYCGDDYIRIGVEQCESDGDCSLGNICNDICSCVAFSCEWPDTMSRSCGLTDIGLCSYGTQTRTCEIGSLWGAWGACIGAVNPVREICGDEKDNDCDGFIDEGCHKTIPIMNNNLFMLLIVFVLILGFYGLKKYGR